MENTERSRSPNVKKLKDISFKLPIQESIKIIQEVRKVQKHAKILKPQQNRKQYQQMLQWVLTKLQATKKSIQSKKSHIEGQNNQIQNILNEALQQEVQIQQRNIIQTLMQEMIEMFKRQCKEKSQLMQVCFAYFNGLINSYSKHYQNELYETFKTYNGVITKMEDSYEDKITDFQKKIQLLEGEKQTKWRNIYMLAKDNRILRRQKGKMLRTIQQQDQKIKVLEQQFCQIVKQNQMNKLIIRFQNDTNNLKVFLKNRIAIMKFEKILETYPKKALKVLNNDLLKLQIEQLNSLDSKIDYIKRVIVESGDIFDQYEDLNDLIQKPNKMVFNMYAQTDPQDTAPPVQLKDTAVNSDPIRRRLRVNRKLFNLSILPTDKSEQLPKKQQNYRNLSTNSILFRNFYHNKPSSSLKLCIKVFNEKIQHHVGRKSERFEIWHQTQISQNPKINLKRQSKMGDLSFSNGKNKLMSQTYQIPLKKTSLPIRKSDISGNKNYALKSPNSNKSPFGRLSQQKRDTNSFLSFQNYPDQSQIDQIINERNQQSQVGQIEDFQSSNQSEDQTKNMLLIPKFKKNKRISRRATENSPIHSVKDNLSTDSLLVNINQKISDKINIESKLKTSQQTYQKSFKNKERESVLSQKNQKEKIPIKKISRVKTSQNIRKSYNPNKLLTQMQFIEEQQSQTDKNSQQKKQRSNPKNRFSQNKNIRLSKSSKVNSKSNNFNQFKQNFENQLNDGQNKYRISVNPAESERKSKPSQFSLRNKSLRKEHPLKQKQDLIQTCPVNSFFSYENQGNINTKPFMQGVKSKQPSLEGLQSESFDPILIKPYEVKKLVQKIFKSMYVRRKQLLSSPSGPSLRIFIENYLKQIYGQKWKGEKNVLRYIFTVHDREASTQIRVLSLLMNSKVHVQYLEDLFRLYLIMIEKNEYSSAQNYLICNKNKAASILKYLLSIYFDDETSMQVQQNLSILNNFQVDLNEIFIVVQNQLRKHTVETQIYHFLCDLIPQNQQNIDFSQMKEVLFLFKNQPNYHTHVARLKYFFKIYGKTVFNQQNSQNKSQIVNLKNLRNLKGEKLANIKKTIQKEQAKPQIQILPIHKICLYLKRYKWKNLLQIYSFIEEKYTELVGVFIQQQAVRSISTYCLNMKGKIKTGAQGRIQIISIQQNQKDKKVKTHSLKWLLERSKQLIRNHYRYKTSLNRHLLMFVQLSILMYQLQLGMQEVISQPLNLLNLEYKRLKTKEQVDAFLKD